MTKTCPKCLRVLTRDMFYAHPASADGLQGSCKECVRAAVKLNRLAKPEHYREFERRRAMTPKRVAMRAEYRKTERGKERVAAAVKKDIELRPERRAARVIVGSALRLGKLEKKPCEVCGERQVEAHHDDYSKPLSVRWLCPKHHHEHHKRRASMFDIEQPTFQYRD